MKHKEIEMACEVLWVSEETKLPIYGHSPVQCRNVLVRQNDSRGMRCKMLLVTIPKDVSDHCSVRVGDIGIIRFYVSGMFLSGDFRNLVIGISFTYTASANYKRYTEVSQTNNQ